LSFNAKAIIEKLLQSGEETSPEKVKHWWTDILSKIISNFLGHILETKFDEITSSDEGETEYEDL
jgi:hypothetical protein